MREHIRILLVDDNELVRHGLRHMLEPEEDIEVVGDCASAEEALSKIARLYPDIVLMDGQTPRMDRIEATRHFKKTGLHYDSDVIILAESVDYHIKALEAGAASCVTKKDIKGAELAQAIREVYWSKQSPDYREDSAEEAVELVVPPPTNATRLLRFMCQLEESFHYNRDNYAYITHSVGSWNRGTVITILLQPSRLTSLLDKLGNITEVEKVEEEPVAKGAVSSLPKEFGVLPRSSISPSKRIRVTLKETSMASQKPVVVLNQ